MNNPQKGNSSVNEWVLRMTRSFLIAVLAMTTALAPAWTQSVGQDNSDLARCINSDPNIAIPICTRVILASHEPPERLASAFYGRGNAYYAKGDFDRAIEDYSEAIQRRQDYAVAFSNRGIAYVDKHEFQRAISDFSEAIRIASKAPEESRPFDTETGLINRGSAYVHAGDFDLAMQDFNEAIRLKPDDSEAYLNRGIAFSSKGDYDRAIADYDKALQISPKNAYTLNNRGIAYVGKHEFQRAISDFSDALRIASKSTPTVGSKEPRPFDTEMGLSNRGIAYVHAGDFDLAIQDFNEAIRLKPGDADAYLNRGIAFNSKGDYDRAIADYNKALQISPKSAYALYSRAIAKRNKGNIDEAQVDTTAALQIDPTIAGKVGEMMVPVTPAKTDLALTQSVPSCSALRDAGQPSAQAPSYVNEPIEQLKRMVPGLNGVRIQAAENANDGTHTISAQDKTISILSRTSAVIADLMHRMPNLIAKEEVKAPADTIWDNDLPGQGIQRLVMGSGQRGIPITQFETHVYSYRIVKKHTPTGGDTLDEFRTDAHDQSIDDYAHNARRPSSVGFATTWLFFLTGNIQQSHFRYIGEQKIGNRETYALAFAQIPEHEGLRTNIESSYGSCSTPMQGVVWIDKTTFQIVRIQTDLLTPLPGIQLYQLRSIVEYGAVKIRALNLTLWLTADAETQWQTTYGTSEETHLYSHYRLFHSTARILPPD